MCVATYDVGPTAGGRVWDDGDNDRRIKVQEYYCPTCGQDRNPNGCACTRRKFKPLNPQEAAPDIDYSRGGVGYHERGINMHMRSGHRFFIDDPRAIDVQFADIAPSLAKLCRYTGHTGDSRKNYEEFYSVAQHSVLVSEQVPPEMAMVGLLHDATEAYIGDISKPLKLVIGPKIVEIEDRIWAAVAERFGLPREIPAEVKEADLRMFVTERRDILCESTAEWGVVPEPYDFQIIPVDWRTAEDMFRARYRDLLNRSPCG